MVIRARIKVFNHIINFDLQLSEIFPRWSGDGALWRCLLGKHRTAVIGNEELDPNPMPETAKDAEQRGKELDEWIKKYVTRH